MNTPNKDIVENFLASGEIGIKLHNCTKNRFNGIRIYIRRSGNDHLIAVDRQKVGYFLINQKLLK